MKLALLALLLAAFVDAAPADEPGKVLLVVPAGADPQGVMQAARNAFIRRKWTVSSDADGVIVARNRNFDVDAMLKVYLADGAVRFVDGTVDAKGRKGQVPERWLNYIRADLRRLERRADMARDAGPVERLRKLKAMLDAGFITPSEYESKRAEILRSL